jgi:cysteine desulfurase
MTKERLYFDYNATTPLSPPVVEWVENNKLPFGNPSSVHTTGKASRRIIGDTSDFLFDLFGLSEDEFKIFFHSGATEGINSVVKGMALECSKNKESFSFISIATDHSCVANQKEFLEVLGHDFVSLPVTSSGELDLERANEILSGLKTDVNLMNWTWVNNESGVVLDLNSAQELKSKFNLLVHVDGVQAPGKIKEWKALNKSLDFYTFSGHKFGSMKGVGFTLCREPIRLMPLMNGGGQQKGMRSGTENSTSIMTLCKSLNYLDQNYNFEEQRAAKDWLENQLEELLEDSCIIAGKKARKRNGNTIYFILKGVPAHTSAMAFDMAGIDLSNGSACSSGAVIPSRVLMGMGFSEEESKQALRLSFSPYLNIEKAQKFWTRFAEILKRFKN